MLFYWKPVFSHHARGLTFHYYIKAILKCLVTERHFVNAQNENIIQDILD